MRRQRTSVRDLIVQFNLPSLLWKHKSAFFGYTALNKSLGKSGMEDLFNNSTMLEYKTGHFSPSNLKIRFTM